MWLLVCRTCVVCAGSEGVGVPGRNPKGVAEKQGGRSENGYVVFPHILSVHWGYRKRGHPLSANLLFHFSKLHEGICEYSDFARARILRGESRVVHSFLSTAPAGGGSSLPRNADSMIPHVYLLHKLRPVKAVPVRSRPRCNSGWANDMLVQPGRRRVLSKQNGRPERVMPFF
jgi:hypothetical protein